MKKIIFILAFIFINNIFCQTDKGVIQYKKVRLKKVFNQNKKQKSKNFNTFAKIENSINEIQKKLTFNLLYNRGESHFEVQKKMEVSENKFFKMSLGPDGISKFYNSKNEILKSIYIFGEKFLISKSNYKWTLKTDTKKINKYTCYKAVTIEKMKTRNGIKNILVEAWYAPEINIPFGPIGYSGLPGLILELKKDNIKYYVTSINLNQRKKILVKKPTNGKKVTQEEYYDIAINAMKNFRKNRGY